MACRLLHSPGCASSCPELTPDEALQASVVVYCRWRDAVYRKKPPLHHSTGVSEPQHRNGLIGLSHATKANKAVLGHLMLVASQVARSEGLSDGYRVVINDGVNGCALLACALP